MNSAADDCSNEKGTLEWAIQRCEEVRNCYWIHDYQCDNKNWRFCFNSHAKEYIGPNENGCAKVKPGEITLFLYCIFGMSCIMENTYYAGNC